MLDRRIARDDLGKQPPARPVLKPGDANWRPRWLAAVRRRMSADPFHAARMRLRRVEALGAEPTLWAELRDAEVSYTRGEGEFYVPGQDDAGAAR